MDFSCCWHGCPTCFHGDAKMPTGNLASEDLANTKERENGIIYAGYEMQTIWTCEIEEMLSKNPEMAEFFENCPDAGPIKIRDSFIGGRLNSHL